MNPRVLVCLSASSAWYGKLIRWATNSKVNHSFIEHEDPFWGGWRATEINESGPHDVAISKLTRIDYIEHWACNVDLVPSLRKMSRFVGSSRYDWGGLLWGLVRSIWAKLTRREVRMALKSNSSWFCSEFVATVFKDAGLKDTASWIPGNISPGELRTFMLLSDHFSLVQQPGDRDG